MRVGKLILVEKRRATRDGLCWPVTFCQQKPNNVHFGQTGVRLIILCDAAFGGVRLLGFHCKSGRRLIISWPALGSDLGKLEKLEKLEKNSQGHSLLSQGRIFLKVAPQT